MVKIFLFKTVSGWIIISKRIDGNYTNFDKLRKRKKKQPLCDDILGWFLGVNNPVSLSLEYKKKYNAFCWTDHKTACNLRKPKKK